MYLSFCEMHAFQWLTDKLHWAQQERDHQMRAEELQEEINQRETHIIKLKEEVKRLQAAINTLNRVIAEKDSDTQKVRCQLKEQLR